MEVFVVWNINGMVLPALDRPLFTVVIKDLSRATNSLPESPLIIVEAHRTPGKPNHVGWFAQVLGSLLSYALFVC